MICTIHQMFLGWSNQRGRYGLVGLCSTHGVNRRFVGCNILVIILEGKRPLERSRHRWDNIKTNFKQMLWKYYVRFRSELMSLGRESNEGVLQTRHWSFGLHKELRIFLSSWATIGSQEMFRSMELFSCFSSTWKKKDSDETCPQILNTVNEMSHVEILVHVA
jgi:hypothetical protein